MMESQMLMLKRAIIVSFSLFVTHPFAYAQISDTIAIEIVTLQVSEINTKATIAVKLQNLTDKNLLLYGFESEFNRFANVNSICDVSRAGGKFALFIYDENNTIVEAEWRTHNNDSDFPVTTEQLETMKKQERLNYLSEKRLIKKNESTNFEREIDLKDYHLIRGVYYLQLGYYSGKAIEQVVSKTQVDRDKLSNGAELFQGCAISNRILLIVK
jgi:hypothetical protein